MALIACPKCNSEDINGTPQADSRLLIHCNDCGTEWLRGEARRDPSRPAVRTIDSLHAAFPTPRDVRLDVRERVDLLKAQFLLDHRENDPDVEKYRDRYQELFSREGLATRPAEDLYEFANSDTVGSAGNMSGFNRAWKTQGPDKAAQKVRESIEFLLHGPESLRIEDRLTQLVDGKKVGFPSFNKEPLLTKVLCVVEPDAVPADPEVHGGDRRQEGDRQARLRPRPAAGGEGRLDDRAPRDLEQRPAALAGRQRHPRPAARDAVPRLGEDPPGALAGLAGGRPAAASRRRASRRRSAARPAATCARCSAAAAPRRARPPTSRTARPRAAACGRPPAPRSPRRRHGRRAARARIRSARRPWRAP